MANFTFDVDTKPLAQKVDTVTHHVTGVAVAVTAMEAAVIAAERSGTKQICENVDRGFYFLIKSQISQKLAALNSNVTSKLMVLAQLGIALKGVKTQMEKDYRMISARYTKLFHSLDMALQARVFELDKAASKLAVTQKSDVYNHIRDVGASFLTHQKETVPFAQQTISSRMKLNTVKGIRFIADRLREDDVLKQQLQDVLSPVNINERVLCQLPVMVTEMESTMNANSYYVNIVLPELPSSFDAQRASIETVVKENTSTLNWQNITPETNAVIKNEFFILCENSQLDERVRKEMLRLYESSTWAEASGLAI